MTLRSTRRTLAPDGEHEFEAAPGLPAALPEGERVLWQGSPDAASLARHAFHVRALAGYFALLLAVRLAEPIATGASPGALLHAAMPLTIAGGVALALVGGLAWLSARTTVYTLTDRRIVMRVGIVLSLTFNLPHAAIASAGLRRLPRGCGDLPLALEGDTRIAILHLWPHARPWRLARPEPMLRSVPDAERVAALLTEAWRARHPALAASQSPGPVPLGFERPLVPARAPLRTATGVAPAGR